MPEGKAAGLVCIEFFNQGYCKDSASLLRVANREHKVIRQLRLGHGDAQRFTEMYSLKKAQRMKGERLATGRRAGVAIGKEYFCITVNFYICGYLAI